MFGFNIILGEKKSPMRCKSSLLYKDVIFESNLINKFDDDKLFFETSQFLVVLDGIILNKKDLQGDGYWKDVFIALYQQYGEQLIVV